MTKSECPMTNHRSATNTPWSLVILAWSFTDDAIPVGGCLARQHLRLRIGRVTIRPEFVASLHQFVFLSRPTSRED